MSDNEGDREMERGRMGVGKKRRNGEKANERNGEIMEIKSFRDLHVYQNSLEVAMEIYEISKSFPAEEKYSLTDQIRRSSRSVCANIGEAWRKRRYKAAFISKLNDSEGEAAETQVWLDFALRINLITKEKWNNLNEKYETFLGQLVKMINEPHKWCIPK